MHFPPATKKISKTSCKPLNHISQKFKKLKFISELHFPSVTRLAFSWPVLASQHWSSQIPTNLCSTICSQPTHVAVVISILNCLDLYQYFWVTFCNKILFMYSDAVSISLSFFMSAIPWCWACDSSKTLKEASIEFIWMLSGFLKGRSQGYNGTFPVCGKLGSTPDFCTVNQRCVCVCMFTSPPLRWFINLPAAFCLLQSGTKPQSCFKYQYPLGVLLYFRGCRHAPFICTKSSWWMDCSRGLLSRLRSKSVVILGVSVPFPHWSSVRCTLLMRASEI